MPALLATGFVADDPAEASFFPSAGGNSGDPRVQAVYWRCLTMFFASARITNPDLRLALFTNVIPPTIDGADLGAVLESYGVELRLVPIAARLAPEKAQSWGNVLYFLDIMDALSGEDPALRIALTDSDVLVTASIAPLFALLDNHDFAGYVVGDTGQDDMVNGLSRREMDAIARALGPTDDRVAEHFGGELFMATPAVWANNRNAFRALFEAAQTGEGEGAAVRTEEHIYTIAFAGLAGRVARANGLMRRIWTSPRHNTSHSGDEDLPIWHLPAEKRYGFRDLFDDFRKRGFPQNMDAGQFHAMARARCGIPAKRPAKILRDGLFQVALKFGYRR